MRHDLVLPHAWLPGILQRLRRTPDGAIRVPVGMTRTEDGIAWLVRSADAAIAARDVPMLVIGRAQILLMERPALEGLLLPEDTGVLLIGDGAARGRAWGMVRSGDRLVPLRTLLLPGPGMHRLALGQWTRVEVASDAPAGQPPSLSPVLAAVSGDEGRWSRTIGALGGLPAWRRLVGLRYAVVGVGRTGSLVASSLAKLGAVDVTLIDGDVLEEHSLAEMDAVTATDLGRNKAEAVAARLQSDIWGWLPPKAEPPSPRVRAVPVSVTEAAARAACLAADVLVCCADNDAARLATALLATLHHKVLVDIGTGIAFGAAPAGAARGDAARRPERIMGADVRLIVPGAGCLLCVGGLARLSRAVDDLTRSGLADGTAEPWHRQRAGSLRALNHVAAHLALLQLQDLVIGRAEGSRWLRLEIDPTGLPRIVSPPAPPGGAGAPCALCARAGSSSMLDR